MSNFGITGEHGTGFEESGGKGPFECGNCVHMSGEVCKHPIMVKISKQSRDRDNYPYVDKHDCCTYVRRPPRKL